MGEPLNYSLLPFLEKDCFSLSNDGDNGDFDCHYFLFEDNLRWPSWWWGMCWGRGEWRLRFVRSRRIIYIRDWRVLLLQTVVMGRPSSRRRPQLILLKFHPTVYLSQSSKVFRVCRCNCHQLRTQTRLNPSQSIWKNVHQNKRRTENNEKSLVDIFSSIHSSSINLDQSLFILD